MTEPDLSIVVPTLNEASALPRLLEDLRAQRGLRLDVVVADGGSTDDTTACAMAAGARVVRSARGRGRQMNAGAAQARAAWLLFLHADSRLPAPALLACALAAMRAAREHGTAVAGHFPLRFVGGSDAHRRFYDWLAQKTRTGRPYSINGDQGLLIAAADFRALGGYDERRAFLEDQELARRVRADGGWTLLPGELLTSARRFEREGPLARYTLMSLIMGAWAAGVDAFFERAPALYAAQADTAALDLAPYARLARRLLREQGLGAFATLLRLGRFARENAWQLAFYLDWRGYGDGRWLRRYDRYLQRAFDNRLADAVAALLVAAWLFLWLPLRLRR